MEVKNQTELGKQAKTFMNEGKLVPDSLIFGMIGKAMDKPDCKGVMFDGFPRSLEQAKELDKMLKLKKRKLASVLYLDVPDNLLVERGTGRRIHTASGRTYHLKYKPPKREGLDDITGEPLIHRDDDKEETIKNRLKVFHENNKAVLDHYDSQNITHKIKADQEIGRASCRERVSSPV